MALVIRQERIHRGWTQEYVANQIGLTKGAFRNIETAQRRPSYPVLVKLEDLFDLPHHRLFAAADDTQSLTENNNTTQKQAQGIKTDNKE